MLKIRVRRYHKFIANVSLRSQWATVKVFLEHQRPTWSASFIMWDETSQRMMLASKESAVQTLVVKAWLAWGSGGAHDSQQFVIPPMPIPTTSAAALWDAMHFHPFMADLRAHKAKLFKYF